MWQLFLISACGLMDSDSRVPVKVNVVKVDALQWNHNRPVSPRSCLMNGYQFSAGELVILCNINIPKSPSKDLDQFYWKRWAVFGVLSPGI